MITTSRWTGIYDDEDWLDFMEDELDLNSMKDREVLLLNSLADRRTLRELERLRDLVKETDEVALPEDGHYYDRLHEKIMLGVDENVNGRCPELHDAFTPEAKLGFAAMWTALTTGWMEI